MKGFYIAPIVEGEGEVDAVPVLLRRIHSGSGGAGLPLIINKPIRVKANRFVRDPEDRRRYVELAALKAAHSGARPLVLILLDSEDDCPARLGPQLLEECQQVRPDVPVMVVLAHREFETWFIAAAYSLAGRRGLPTDLAPLDQPESRRDAKGWLAARMGRRYNEPLDQPAFAQVFDFSTAAGVPSFRRCLEKLTSFFDQPSPR